MNTEKLSTDAENQQEEEREGPATSQATTAVSTKLGIATSRVLLVLASVGVVTGGVVGVKVLKAKPIETPPAAAEPQPALPIPLREPETSATPETPVVAPLAESATHPRITAFLSERLLIEEARTALADRKTERAWTAIEEHARRFPTGRLTEEREALRIRVLRLRGETDRADEATRAFRSRFPKSLLLPESEWPGGFTPAPTPPSGNP